MNFDSNVYSHPQQAVREPDHPVDEQTYLNSLISQQQLLQDPEHSRDARIIHHDSIDHHLHKAPDHHPHNHDSLFHSNINPFDFTTYPLTNPPIFDASMMISITNDGSSKQRRRISISNGQISQLVSHEDDLFDESDNSKDTSTTVENPSTLTEHSTVQSLGLDDHLPIDSMHSMPVQSQHPLQDLHSHVAPLINSNGVPNHSLIYDNEVIFNPNGGPIPGTAAWKRERLLERNRVAASKCRQRKKQAQQQLQSDANKYEKQCDDLRSRVSLLEETLKKARLCLDKHVADGTPALRDLEVLLDMEIIDSQIKRESSEESE